MIAQGRSVSTQTHAFCAIAFEENLSLKEMTARLFWYPQAR